MQFPQTVPEPHNCRPTPTHRHHPSALTSQKKFCTCKLQLIAEHYLASMAVRTRSLVVFSFLCLLVHSSSAVTCFGFDGDAYTNNTICPGSNACCGVTATCLPNRLCHNIGDAAGTFVRGPCALDPYDPTTCAEICLYGTSPPPYTLLY
jgi:hypothetical protein